MLVEPKHAYNLNHKENIQSYRGLTQKGLYYYKKLTSFFKKTPNQSLGDSNNGNIHQTMEIFTRGI